MCNLRHEIESSKLFVEILYLIHDNYKIYFTQLVEPYLSKESLNKTFRHSWLQLDSQSKDNYLDYKEHRNKYETEAESISYVVSNYLGLKENDHSLTYLYAWSKNQDFKEIDDSLNTIVNYSKKIINNYEKFYDKEFGIYAEDYKKMNI